MAISAEQVKKLRERTGAGMGDCKKALEEAGGDETKAIDVLRKKGAASAAKRSDRVAREGMIATAVSGDLSKGIITEINSETDFVARNESFQQFAQSIADAALKAEPTSQDAFQAAKLDSGATIAEEVGAQTGRLGEKLEARRFEMLTAENGAVTSYIHLGAKLGVLVAVTGAEKAKAVEVGREIAMQIAAMNPIALNRESIDTATAEKEIEIYKQQARNEGKKEEIIERIAANKLEKFYQDNCLIEQSFIRDASKTIKDLLKEAGANATVSGYIRMQLGEGVEAEVTEEAEAGN